MVHQPRLLRTSTVLMRCCALNSDSFFTNQHNQPCPRPGPSEISISMGGKQGQASHQVKSAKETKTPTRRPSARPEQREKATEQETGNSNKEQQKRITGIRDPYPTRGGKGDRRQDRREDNRRGKERNRAKPEEHPETQSIPSN